MSKVYRGNPALVHIPDGQRAGVGKELARHLDYLIRDRAIDADESPDYSKFAGIVDGTTPLCPGCYMVAIFNCAIASARANGQSLTELGNSLGDAFKALAQDGSHEESLESIVVQLDSDPCPTTVQS